MEIVDWLKNPLLKQLEHMHPRDALERLIASLIVLVGLAVILALLMAYPERPLPAIAIGLSLTGIMLSVRAFLLLNTFR